MKYRSVKMMRGVMISDENGKFLSTVEVVSLLNDLQQRLAEAESRTCEWQEDSDPDNNLWDGECGAVWEFIADGPIENKCNFCPECGGKLVISERPKREGDIILPQEDSGKGD